MRFMSDLALSPVHAPTGTTVELGVSRMCGNGVSAVGCSQFFWSYSAYGGDSIIWKVYA